MINSPIQNKGIQLAGVWIQTRPVITQGFGERPDVYAQFGMAGHNGLDMRAPIGTPIFAPCDGDLFQLNDVTGYGNHIRIRSREKAIEIILGHLSKFVGMERYVHMGDLIGYSGNTGFSSAPHLHFGVRRLVPNNGPITMWGVKDINNGFKGYFDQTDVVVTWKGSLSSDNL